MKVHNRTTTCCIAIAMMSLLISTSAKAGFVDYNVPGDLTANFALNSGSTGLKFNQVAAGGLGNTGGVDILNALDMENTTAVYNQQSYDLSGPGSSVTLSQFALRRDGQLTSTPFVQLGVTSDTSERMDGNATANSYAGLILFPISGGGANVATDLKLQLERKVQGGSRVRSDAGITMSLLSGHWYKFSTTLTYDTATTLLLSGSLEDWGTTGAAFASSVFSLAPTSIALSGADQVNGDSAVWGAYRGYLEGGSELYDNFSITPEPGSLALLTFGAMLLRRRRAA